MCVGRRAEVRDAPRKEVAGLPESMHGTHRNEYDINIVLTAGGALHEFE